MERQHVYGQLLTSADLSTLPTGSTLDGCSLVVSEPLPLGLNYIACTVKATSDFQGKAMMVCPKEGGEGTAVLNCIMDCENVPAGVAYV